jgi:hypothetical protein
MVQRPAMAGFDLMDEPIITELQVQNNSRA